MDRFRKLTTIALISGSLAGLLLFLVQHFAVFPLIEKAETYESAAEHAMPGMSSEAAEWHPSEGFERTGLTALTTVVTSIGFAAILFSIVSLTNASLNWKTGALWGLAAFVCVDVAPALGLPPQPPGVAVADLYSRQLWWSATVALTALGLWWMAKTGRPWRLRVLGIVGLVIPHLIGAPVATGATVVPAALIHSFALASILTTGVFWISLGLIGGSIYGRWTKSAD